MKRLLVLLVLMLLVAASAVAETPDDTFEHRAVTIQSDEQEQGRVVYDVPGLPLLYKPEEGSAVCALVFDMVQAETLDVRDDYVLIAIGPLSGWIKRENLVIGKDALKWSWGVGEYAQGYVYGSITERPLYQAASEESARVAFVPFGEIIYIQAMTADGAWYLIRLGDGETFGWMPFDTVSQTGEEQDAWITLPDASMRLALREEPGEDGAVVGEYFSGVYVMRLFANRAVKGWSHVIIEGASGWVESAYLEPSMAYSGLDFLPPLRKINGGACPVYQTPDKGGAPICQQPDGTYAEIMGVTGEWAHARFRDGTSGYVDLKWLGGEPESADANRFTLQKSVTLTDFRGQYAWETLPKGTKIGIMERPVGRWVETWPEDSGERPSEMKAEWVYMENSLVYVCVLGTENEGWINADDADFWGK